MIAIIGGGIAGLVAAINIENAGEECMIIEKNSFLGGRVASDQVGELFLDHGFQVLLTDYPYAEKYLDYSLLELKEFQPGAIIYKDGKSTKFGDPLRDFSAILPTFFSWAGSYGDKLKVYQLSKELQLKPVKEIFEEAEKSTLAYLHDFGFSPRIIDNFFKPFFGGIFLESELATSSRMFEFVFKMFGNGAAAIPAEGMAAIPAQLRQQLKKTKIVLNAECEVLDDGHLKLNGEKLAPKGIIKAYAEKGEWQSCSTFYFNVNNRVLKGNIIGLNAEKGSLVNSFYYLDDQTLSVTSLAEGSTGNIEQKIIKELDRKLGIKGANLLKRFDIPRSLPILHDINQKDNSGCHKIGEITIAYAGDHLNYGSLNAAMHSGEMAANAVLDKIDFTDDL